MDSKNLDQLKQSTIKLDLEKRYNSLGETEFCNINLQGANLQGINLSFVNLKGADCRGANLSQAILKGVNLEGANLSKANLSGSQLQGANLRETNLIWGLLANSNLTGVNLSHSNLDASILIEANLQLTNLSQACLYGVDLKGANLTEAYYSDRTKFDKDFDPIKAGMQINTKITVQNALDQFHDIAQVIQCYIGNKLTAKFLKSSCHNFELANAFQFMDSSPKIISSTNQSKLLYLEELGELQLWLNNFIKDCSQIVHTLPTFIEQEGISFIIGLSTKSYKTNNFNSDNSDSSNDNDALFGNFGGD